MRRPNDSTTGTRKVAGELEQIEELYEHLLTAGRADSTGGLATKSVLEVHVLLRRILDDAVTRGLLNINPARQAVPPRHRRDQHRRRMAWTAHELSTFLAAMAGHRHHRIWWLAAHTGIRRSEFVGLRWHDIDIDLDHRRLSITRTIVAVNGRMQSSNVKTAKAATTIDLDDRKLSDLAHWQRDHADRFGQLDPECGLVVRDEGQAVNPQSVSQGLDRAVARTDLPRLGLHGLRHTHASLPGVLKAGVPLEVVFERLGHSTPAFTMAAYQHVLPGRQAVAAATFASLLDDAGE